jgi:hypothetical protein
MIGAKHNQTFDNTVYTCTYAYFLFIIISKISRFVHMIKIKFISLLFPRVKHNF